MALPEFQGETYPNAVKSFITILNKMQQPNYIQESKNYNTLKSPATITTIIPIEVCLQQLKTLYSTKKTYSLLCGARMV